MSYGSRRAGLRSEEDEQVTRLFAHVESLFVSLLSSDNSLTIRTCVFSQLPRRSRLLLCRNEWQTPRLTLLFLMSL